MLIGIDMLGVQSPQGRREAARVGRQLTSALLARDSDHRFVLYAHESWPVADIPSGRNALRIAIDDAGRVRDQNPDGLDWLIQLDPFSRPVGGALDGLKVASLVVDLAPNRVDDHRFASLRRDDAILAFSESTALECRKRLGQSADRVTTLGLASEATNEVGVDLGRFGISGPFLFAGRAGGTGRDDLAGILEGYCLLPIELRSRHQLAIAGTVDDPWGVVLSLHERGAAEGLVLLGEVDERTLRTLYRECSAFVAPSIEGGSGLALVEAMSFGAIVVASRAGSQAAIVGDGGLLVDPSDRVEIAGRIGLALSDPKLRRNLGRKALARASRYSWEPVVDRVFEVLEAGEMPAARPRLRFDPAAAEPVRGPLVEASREAERSLIG